MDTLTAVLLVACGALAYFAVHGMRRAHYWRKLHMQSRLNRHATKPTPFDEDVREVAQMSPADRHLVHNTFSLPTDKQSLGRRSSERQRY